MYESILVATDGSDTAAVAADHAIELARRFDASLSAVAVLESRTEYDNAIVDPEEVERRRREAAEATLEELEDAADAEGVPVETAVRSGVPYEEILAYAVDCDADAIVVGARGGSPFRRALLGSTADRVLRTATVPVMIVEDDENYSSR